MTFFALFFAHCVVGVIMAENRPVAFSYMSNTYVKIALMVFIITYLTQTPRQLRWIGRMIVMCGMLIAYVAIKNKLAGVGLVEGTRVTISRELGSVLGDPNDLALTLLFPFSFAATMVMCRGGRVSDKLLGIAGVGVILLAIIYTQSRGGLLGIMTVMAVIAWFRVRSKALLICLGVMAMMVLFVAAGISDRSSGGAAEEGIDESANICLHAWMAAFNMALRNPFTGVGIDNYYVNFFFYSDFWDNKNHAVHSTWFGVMGETGFVGFILFIMMVWQLLRSARGLHRNTRITRGATKDERSFAITSEALLAGIFSFMVSGTFLTQGFTWPIYILMALTVATMRMHNTHRRAAESTNPHITHRRRNMNMSTKQLLISTTMLTFLWNASHAHAQEAQNVDVELQLLIDVSGSVSTSEYNLMMDGYANAFRSSDVQDIILDDANNSYGNIAVQAVMWSSINRQQTVTDWTLLNSVDSILDYANTLDSITRPFTGTTYLAEGLDYGSALFSDNGFSGTRSVIDVSGDGYGYDYLYRNYSGFGGMSTTEQRDLALSSGIDTINGITIEGAYYQSGDQTLTQWYSTDVIGGDNAFVIAANGFADFERALTQKLSAEIDGTYIPPEALPPASTAPSPAMGGGLSLFIIAAGGLWWQMQQRRGLLGA